MEGWNNEMSQLYQYIIGGATTDFDKILQMVFFFIIFQGLLYVMMELMKIGGGRR